jgi:phospholipid/cholesterol/gamma-HCH transport system permease protein
LALSQKTDFTPERLRFQVSDEGTIMIMVSGKWQLEEPLPSSDEIIKTIRTQGHIKVVTFDTEKLSAWDTGFLIFLNKIISFCLKNNVAVDQEGLPGGVRRLLLLASKVPERKDARKETVSVSFLARTGEYAVVFGHSVLEMLGFIGEIFQSLLRTLVGKGHFRGSDLLLFLQEAGAQALPIVSLISLLVGLILAFVGAIQLRMFGAQIYVADLVGIAMVREMGAIMTGIIMAGRTGASYAAQIGTMQVNEEIDALKTLGIPPIDFLVTPRMLALSIMMPFLTVYANLMGIFGGLIVGVFGLDLSLMQYYNETKSAVRFNDLWIGLFSGFVFGILVATAGCMRGMQCGRSAQAVGEATTSAVVTGIVSIVIATAIITVICNALGI